MEFKKQYESPKWQKRRAEYIEKQCKNSSVDTPYCEWCEDNENQLHLHHLQYKTDTHIWDYPDSNFILLCSNCHKQYHEILDSIKDCLIVNPEDKYRMVYVHNIVLISSILDSIELVYLNKICENYLQGVVDGIRMNKYNQKKKQ